jgi:hypothetical protein
MPKLGFGEQGAGKPAHSIFQVANFTPKPLKLKAKALFSNILES